jgi:indole-3-glycerol phosphate synthase
MTILDKIIARKQEEVAERKAQVSVKELEMKGYFAKTTNSLKTSLLNPSSSGIISEFKRKSPSKGIINANVTPEDVTFGYVQAGAACLSVLTDIDFFGGSDDDFLRARKANPSIPMIRKDFMIDEYQFYEAKSIGADVVLLIASCLSPTQVWEFTELAHSLNLEVLLEIHSEEELKHINKNVDFVGINNRNLKDFKVDLQHSVELKNQLPEDIFSIAESGIYNEEDFKFLKEKGFDGFLMGEYFMKDENPGEKFGKFISNVSI